MRHDRMIFPVSQLAVATVGAIERSDDHRYGLVGKLLSRSSTELRHVVETQDRAALVASRQSWRAFEVLGKELLEHWLHHETLLMEAAKILLGHPYRPLSFTDPMYRLLEMPLRASQGRSFTATTTFPIPGGVTLMFATLIGGGGSGGGTAAAGANGGGGGGGGESIIRYPLVVVPGTSTTVTIGAGGTAPAAGANNGNVGSATTFAALLSAAGGLGGISGTTGTGGAGGGAYGAAGAAIASDTRNDVGFTLNTASSPPRLVWDFYSVGGAGGGLGSAGTGAGGNGGRSSRFAGGTGGSTLTRNGGGGGSTALGSGGNGPTTDVDAAAAGNNTGGGGAGAGRVSTARAGGAGGSGLGQTEHIGG